jgi:deoxyhypusine monooxygenase
MSTPALAQLASVLQDDKAALDSRFRSLFALKGLASSSIEQTKEVIDIISKAFDDNDSALLKHELAYVLGQIQSEDAIDCLESVLKDEAEHPMVRHEVNTFSSLPCILMLIQSAFNERRRRL